MLLNMSFTNNYLTMWNHYICFHPRNLAFVDITPRKQQSGIKVYNDIVMALDSGFSTALLLLDFYAAFDCVDHSILLKVLQLQFGITASALQWISSLLALRSHSVKLSGSSSKICSVLFGVPQGSILGPLLFILYTSNIINIASQHGLMVHL